MTIRDSSNINLTVAWFIFRGVLDSADERAFDFDRESIKRRSITDWRAGLAYESNQMKSIQIKTLAELYYFRIFKILLPLKEDLAPTNEQRIQRILKIDLHDLYDWIAFTPSVDRQLSRASKRILMSWI